MRVTVHLRDEQLALYGWRHVSSRKWQLDMISANCHIGRCQGVLGLYHVTVCARSDIVFDRGDPIHSTSSAEGSCCKHMPNNLLGVHVTTKLTPSPSLTGCSGKSVSARGYGVHAYLPSRVIGYAPCLSTRCCAGFPAPATAVQDWHQTCCLPHERPEQKSPCTPWF